MSHAISMTEWLATAATCVHSTGVILWGENGGPTALVATAVCVVTTCLVAVIGVCYFLYEVASLVHDLCRRSSSGIKTPPCSASVKAPSLVRAVLDDPERAARLCAHAGRLKEEVLAVAFGDIYLPPSLERVYCAECLAVAHLMFPNKLAWNNYMQMDEMLLKAPREYVGHDGCPCDGGSNLYYLAYMVKWMLRRSLCKVIEVPDTPPVQCCVEQVGIDGDKVVHEGGRQRDRTVANTKYTERKVRDARVRPRGQKDTGNVQNSGGDDGKGRNPFGEDFVVEKQLTYDDELRQRLNDIILQEEMDDIYGEGEGELGNWFEYEQRFELRLEQFRLQEQLTGYEISDSEGDVAESSSRYLRKEGWKHKMAPNRKLWEAARNTKPQICASCLERKQDKLRAQIEDEFEDSAARLASSETKGAVHARYMALQRAYSQLTTHLDCLCGVGCSEVESLYQLSRASVYGLGSDERQAAELQGEKDPVIFNDDTRHRLVGRVEAMNRMAEFTLEGQAAADEHFKVVQRLMEELGSEESRKHPTPQLYKLESEMVSSKKTTVGDMTASVRVGADRRGAYVYGTAAGSTIVTHRHYCEDDEVRDVVWQIGQRIHVTLCLDTPMAGPLSALHEREAKITAVFARPGQDLVYYFVDLKVPVLDTRHRTHNLMPTVGMSVSHCTLFTDSAKGTYEWRIASGAICAEKDGHVFYDFTTAPGDCGYPVYAADGSLLACHLWGNVPHNGRKYNGGLMYGTKVPPQKTGTFKVPSFDVNEADGQRQGRVLKRGVMKYMVSERHKRMTEKFTVRGLRADRDLRGLKPLHYWAKPSTKMNKEELSKFADELDYKLDNATLERAVTAAVLFDMFEPIRTVFQHPTAEGCAAVLETMDPTKSSGSTGCGKTAMQYFAMLGRGDVTAGKSIVVDRAMRLYQTMCGEGDNQDQELLALSFCWYVIGKKDGYKKKKLPLFGGSGRTIQCPCIELKLLWLVCFGDNDRSWLHRGGSTNHSWIHQGEDADLPTRADVVEAVATCKSILSLDAEAWDRHMVAPFMRAFFLVYLPEVCVGAPQKFIETLARLTIFGILVHTDGSVTQKLRGNPSGFMNTLRMNCVVHIMAIMYVVAKRYPDKGACEMVAFVKEHLMIQICGDDSRVFALTSTGDDFLDARRGFRAYLQVWEEDLPWVVKIEGSAVFEDDTPFKERLYASPPIVSRCFAYVDGIIWEPLFNVSRVLKRLVCNERRDAEQERALVVSAFSSLAMHVDWMFRRNPPYISPPVAMLLREFADPEVLGQAKRRYADLAACAPARQPDGCRRLMQC